MDRRKGKVLCHKILVVRSLVQSLDIRLQCCSSIVTTKFLSFIPSSFLFSFLLFSLFFFFFFFFFLNERIMNYIIFAVNIPHVKKKNEATQLHVNNSRINHLQARHPTSCSSTSSSRPNLSLSLSLSLSPSLFSPSLSLSLSREDGYNQGIRRERNRRELKGKERER